MLNLKKGLALVLAAATAFTFAPVANLGASVQAEAAETKDLVTPDGNSVQLWSNVSAGKNKTVTFKIKDLSKFTGVDEDSKTAGVTATVDDTSIAKITAATVSGTAHTMAAGDDKELAGLKDYDGSDPAKTDGITVTAQKKGSTKITFSFANVANMGAQYTQTVTINVDEVSQAIELDTSKLEAKKVKTTNGKPDFDIYKDGSSTVTTSATPGNGYTDQTVATKIYNIPSDKFDQVEVTSTNTDAVKIQSGDKLDFVPTSSTTPQNTTLRVQGLGTAIITFRVYQYDDSTHTKGKVEVAEKSITVTVTDSTDTLTVSYDADRDGKNKDYTVGTSSDDIKAASAPLTAAGDSTNYDGKTAAVSGGTTTWTDGVAGSEIVAATNVGSYATVGDTTWAAESYGSPVEYHWVAQSHDKYVSDILYLDTNENKVAKINATDAQGRPVIFSSSSNAVAVDQDGNVSLTNNAFDANDTRSTVTNPVYITVTVPKSGSGKDTVAGLSIRFQVKYTKTEVTKLTVRRASNQEILGQVLGNNTNWTGDINDLKTLYLSTKDKSSDTVVVDTNAGAKYYTGVAYDNDLNTLSSRVQYNNGTISLKKDATAGDAIVKITAYNNGTNLDQSEVYFHVVVSNKNAGKTVTVSNDTINLTAAAPTAKIDAKTDSTSTLHYEFVKEIGSSEKTSSGDLTLGEYSGNLTYTGHNDGTAYVRVSGFETLDSLEPAAKWVTVNYSSTLAPSPLKVTSDKNVSLKVGETSQIAASASGAAISYTSADPTVATVDNTGKIEAKAYGATVITVSTPATATNLAGNDYVTVVVSKDGAIDTVIKPSKVTGVKVTNVKGNKVKVTWTKQNQKNIKYYVKKTVGKKSSGKSVNGRKTTLQVKKGATVKVKVKAYVYDETGKKLVGTYSKTVSKKTDKK